jgi:hypothetical protein
MDRGRNKNTSKVLTKRKRNTNRNKTVKFISGKPLVLRTSFRKAAAFHKELEEIPIYFINAHSCICLLEGVCMGEKVPSFFEIPADTYLLTQGEAGDYSCLTELALDILISASEDIRDFLTVHSASDMRDLMNGKQFSLFGQMQRAAQNSEKGEKLMYPNINYSFNPDKGTLLKDNKYGVYRIDGPYAGLSSATVNNKMSILKHNTKRDNWFLSDIIREVYEATGIYKGIFLNGGCLSSCSSKAPSGAHIEKAAMTMAHANAMYPTVRETLTAEEMEEKGMYIPGNIGSWHKYFKINPNIAKELVNSGLYKANDLLKNKNIWANEGDIAKFREYTQ